VKERKEASGGRKVDSFDRFIFERNNHDALKYLEGRDFRIGVM